MNENIDDKDVKRINHSSYLRIISILIAVIIGSYFGIAVSIGAINNIGLDFNVDGIIGLFLVLIFGFVIGWILLIIFLLGIIALAFTISNFVVNYVIGYNLNKNILKVVNLISGGIGVMMLYHTWGLGNINNIIESKKALLLIDKGEYLILILLPFLGLILLFISMISFLKIVKKNSSF